MKTTLLIGIVGFVAVALLFSACTKSANTAVTDETKTTTTVSPVDTSVVNETDNLTGDVSAEVKATQDDLNSW